ncbi:MAG: ABC transporter permease [Candidatus Diapherotrites archaeon]|nr:ABC transporter permease [Candidatus Diapherotrites archaeon]
MAFETLRFALTNLKSQPLRSNLTVLSVIIGIASIVALVSLGQGVTNSFLGYFQSLGATTILVEPGSSFAEAAFSRVPESDLRLIEGVTGVEAAMGFYETSATAKYGSQTASLFVIGIDPDKIVYLEETGYMQLLRGRFLSGGDKYGILVHEEFLENAFDGKVGLRQSIEIKGKKFQLVGILKKSDVAFSSLSNTNIVWASKDTVKELFSEPDPTELAVKVVDKNKINEIAGRIEAKLERKHGEKKFQVLTPDNILEQTNAILGVLQVVVLAIAAISLVVGGIGIMNTMAMAVIDRTSEIGLMKAVGATNTKILSVFLAEAGMIGLFGGLLGTVSGYLIAFGISAVVSGQFAIPITVDLAFVAQVLGFSLLVGMISGFLPAQRAAKMDPTEALRYE